MAQTQRISSNNTTIRVADRVGGPMVVTLHSTDIVRLFPDRVELNTGGYLTTTTITRMNQVANQFRLGFHVSRAGGNLTARLADGRVLESRDGRTLSIPR